MTTLAVWACEMLLDTYLGMFYVGYWVAATGSSGPHAICVTQSSPVLGSLSLRLIFSWSLDFLFPLLFFFFFINLLINYLVLLSCRFWQQPYCWSCPTSGHHWSVNFQLCLLYLCMYLGNSLCVCVCVTLCKLLCEYNILYSFIIHYLAVLLCQAIFLSLAFLLSST